MSRFVVTRGPTCNIQNTHTKLGSLTFSQNLIVKKKSEWAKTGSVGLLKQLFCLYPFPFKFSNIHLALPPLQNPGSAPVTQSV